VESKKWINLLITPEQLRELLIKGRRQKSIKQNYMPEQLQTTVPQALYSQNLKTKSKTYFFDVRAAKNGNKYLSISETWMKDGQKHRSTVTVFKDNLDEFSQVIGELQEKVKTA